MSVELKDYKHVVQDELRMAALVVGINGGAMLNVLMSYACDWRHWKGRPPTFAPGSRMKWPTDCVKSWHRCSLERR